MQPPYDTSRTVRCYWRGARLPLLVSLGTLLAAQSCEPPSIFAVTVAADSGSGSLRAAIDSANAERARPVRIEIPSGSYELTRCSADDTNTNGDLDLTTDVQVTLVATGGAVTITQKCAGERVLDDLGLGILTLAGITVTGGSITSVDPAVPAAGAGVRTRGSVHLDHSTITGNSAAGSVARGGGLFVGASLVATEATIAANSVNGSSTAEGGAAFVTGAIAIVGGRVEGNRALGGVARGGGLAQESALAVVITGTLFGSNRAEAGRGAIAKGGALAVVGSLRAELITATNNAVVAGPPLDLAYYSGHNFPPGPELPPLPPAVEATRGGAFAADGEAAIVRSNFSGNQAIGGPGSVLCQSYQAGPATFPGGPTTCLQCSGGVGSAGAGGAVWSGRHLTVTESNYRDNSVSVASASCYTLQNYGQCFSGPLCQINPGPNCYSFGALYPFQVCPAGASVTGAALESDGEISVRGGAYTANLGRQSADSGTIHTQSAVSFSEASLTANDSGIFAGASVLAERATIAGNRSAGIRGGSVSVVNATIADNAIVALQLTLDHATVTNEAGTAAMAPLYGGPLELTSFRSVVIVPPTQAVCPSVAADPVSSYNWFSDASCALPGTSNHQGSAAFLLGPLAGNGGPVQTRLPANGSVLINAVPVAACPTKTDARGVTRPQGSACDIGAVEVQY